MNDIFTDKLSPNFALGIERGGPSPRSGLRVIECKLGIFIISRQIHAMMLQAYSCYQSTRATSVIVLPPYSCYKRTRATSVLVLPAYSCYQRTRATSVLVLQAYSCYQRNSATNSITCYNSVEPNLVIPDTTVTNHGYNKRFKFGSRFSTAKGTLNPPSE